MIKAVIFDMDGVLIDSVEHGLRARKKLLASYDIDIETVPDPQGENHRASSLKSFLENVEHHKGVHINHDAAAKKLSAHIRESLVETGTAADPGLVAFLDDLRQHDVICAIVSSGLPEGVNTKLEILGLKDYFSVVVTGNDVAEHKPRPEPYLYALRQLHLPPERCIIFEDSLTGIQAGRAAGCRVIAFTQYNPPKKPLAGIVAVVSNWDDASYDMLERLPDTPASSGIL